jgi:hypothetical protein
MAVKEASRSRQRSQSWSKQKSEKEYIGMSPDFEGISEHKNYRASRKSLDKSA